MSRPDTSYAYFMVQGSFNPAEITKRVGISPTDAVMEGEPGRYAHAVKCSRWELRSRMDHAANLEAHVLDVLDQLDANRARFVQLSWEFGGTMQLVGYFQDREPGVHFGRDIIRRFADYGLDVDCDFYSRSSDR